AVSRREDRFHRGGYRVDRQRKDGMHTFNNIDGLAMYRPQAPYQAPRGDHHGYHHLRLNLNSLTKQPKEILASKLHLNLQPSRPMQLPPKKRGRGNTKGRDIKKYKVINMIRSWPDDRKRKSAERNKSYMKAPIIFPLVSLEDTSNEPLIIEAAMEGYLVRRVYVDQGASVDVMFEHCFKNLSPAMKSRLRSTQINLVGFTGGVVKPLGKVELEVVFGDGGLRNLRAVSLMIHSMVKFSTSIGVATLVIQTIIISECRRLEKKQMIGREAHHNMLPDEQGQGRMDLTKGILVNMCFLDQLVTIEGNLSEGCKNRLKALLKKEYGCFRMGTSRHDRAIDRLKGGWRYRRGRKRQLDDSHHPMPGRRNMAGRLGRKEGRYTWDPVKCTLDQEAKPLSKITRKEVKKFVWDNIVCRFGLPRFILTDNKTQFVGWCERLNMKQMNTTIAHQHANGLVERANKSLMEGIKARLGRERAGWVDELPNVLCSHHTSLKQSNGETPFSLTYKSEAVIPVEIGMPTHGTIMIKEDENEDELRKLAKYLIELGTYNITYEPRNAVKGQILVEFFLEAPIGTHPEAFFLVPAGVQNKDDVENPSGIEFTYALHLNFISTNNEAEYEALLAGLYMATKMKVKVIDVKVDSKLVTSQINGDYVASSTSMIKYLATEKEWRYTWDPVECTLDQAIDNFTKWIEAKPLSKITRKEVKKFVWDNISNGETPFSLTYKSEAVIPVEIGMPTHGTIMIKEDENEDELRLNMDLLQERRKATAI
nr:reverse transcriptase domain-containing protein [Tanacetum cinerariifolium]